MRFMMIVSRPDIAAFVATRGVDRLMVDLEWIGKAERQPGDTWKSRATLDDVTRVRAAVPGTELMVRLNPSHDGTAGEVEAAIARGADWLMLPMWREAGEVADFLRLVGGRARVMPLAETAGALAALPEMLARARPDALMIGLNDLSIDLGRSFMFQPLVDGTLDLPCARLREAGLEFGIGGVARAGEGALPPEVLLGEHARLGSDWVILSRTFHRSAASAEAMAAEMDFAAEVARLQTIHAAFLEGTPAALEANHARARAMVATVTGEPDRTVGK